MIVFNIVNFYQCFQHQGSVTFDWNDIEARNFCRFVEIYVGNERKKSRIKQWIILGSGVEIPKKFIILIFL